MLKIRCAILLSNLKTSSKHLLEILEHRGYLLLEDPSIPSQPTEGMVLAIILLDHISAVPMLIMDWDILKDHKALSMVDMVVLVQVKPINIDRIMGHLFQLFIQVRHITAVFKVLFSILDNITTI